MRKETKKMELRAEDVNWQVREASEAPAKASAKAPAEAPAAKSYEPPTMTAVRCPECNGETFVRTSDVQEVPLLDPATGDTYSHRRRRYYQCKKCGAVRVVNFPAGEKIA